MSDNPFERYDIDPHEGQTAITERFRELLEDAKDEDERSRLRTAWEKLTVHPVDRWRAALATHPSAGSVASADLPRPKRRAPMAEPQPITAESISPSDLACPAPLAEIFSALEPPLDPLSPLEEDPLLFVEESPKPVE